MGVQNWSDNIILVNLAPEPQTGEELQTAIEMVTDNGGFDVVVDFAQVGIITSSSIAKLLKLRKAVEGGDNVNGEQTDERGVYRYGSGRHIRFCG